MNNRDIQSLRGFACLALMLYHVVGNTTDRGLQIADGPLRLLVDGLSAVRMPLFALIAGAMHGRHPRWGASLVSDKFRRLLVPGLVVGTVFALVQGFVPGTTGQPRDWYLLHILPVAHYWFLDALFLLFCLMALLQRIGLVDSIARFALVFAASVTAYLFHFGVPWFGISGMFYLMPFFLTGFALERFGWAQLPQGRSLAPFMLATGAVIMVLWASPARQPDRFGVAMLAIGILASAALWMRPVRGAWLARIGDYSYAIFLFHIFFTSATRIALNRLGVDSLGVQVSAGMAMGLAGSIVLQTVVVDRSRLLRALMLGAYGSMPARPTVGIADAQPQRHKPVKAG